MIDACLRFVDRCGEWCARLAALSLLMMAVLMLAEVFARNLLAQSLTFSWEYAGYLMGAAFFFGAAYTLRTGGHVRVSLLAEHVPAPVARLLDVAVTLVGVAVSGFLVYALGDLTLTSYQRSIVSFTPVQTPLIYPQGVLAVGALFLLLQMIARLARLLRGQPPDEEFHGVVPEVHRRGDEQ